MFQTAEQNITSAHEKIAECKKEIQKAKRIRKNRQGNVSSFLHICIHLLRKKNVKVFLGTTFFISHRIRCFSKSNPATPRSPWYTEVSNPLKGLHFFISCSTSCMRVAFKIMKRVISDHLQAVGGTWQRTPAFVTHQGERRCKGMFKISNTTTVVWHILIINMRF